MSKCKYAGCMKALDDYGTEFDYLQCMAQTDEIDYHYFGDDYECGFNDDYEDCPIYRLKNKIDKATEYNKQIIEDTKSFYRPTADTIYSGDCLIDIAEQNISILGGKE